MLNKKKIVTSHLSVANKNIQHRYTDWLNNTRIPRLPALFNSLFKLSSAHGETTKVVYKFNHGGIYEPVSLSDTTVNINFFFLKYCTEKGLPPSSITRPLDPTEENIELLNTIKIYDNLVSEFVSHARSIIFLLDAFCAENNLENFKKLSECTQYTPTNTAWFMLHWASLLDFADYEESKVHYLEQLLPYRTLQAIKQSKEQMERIRAKSLLIQ